MIWWAAELMILGWPSWKMVQYDVFFVQKSTNNCKEGWIFMDFGFFCLISAWVLDILRICSESSSSHGSGVTVRTPLKPHPTKNEERQGHHKFKCSGILWEKTRISDSEIQKHMGNPSKPKPIYGNFFKISARDSLPKKNTSRKKRIWLKNQACVEFFFLKISSFLRPKSADARAAFWGPCTAETTTDVHPSWCRSREPRQARKVADFIGICKTWCFFHTFFGFQKILKRQFLMMWCHNNDVFFCCFPLMVQVQDCWVLPKMVWFWRLM